MKKIPSKYHRLLVGLCLVWVAGYGHATPDLEAGKILYNSCQSCHGVQAEGNAQLQAPNLAGQWAWYLERQLNYFKKSIRGAGEQDQYGAQMRAAASVLADDQAVVNVSAYIASLPFISPANPVTGDLRNGNNYYQAKCGACHGGNAEGNEMINAPRLNGHDGEYLSRQYTNFQKGIRGVHPDDRYGKQMKMMSNSLPTDTDLHDVTAFIHSLPLVSEKKTGGH